jgi:protein gp37
MLHPERLNDLGKTKKPQTIFVCSMADLFGEWVPYEWQHTVFDMCRRSPQHTHAFLTKNPYGMRDALKNWIRDHPDDARNIENWWFGASAGDRGYSNEGQYDPVAALRYIPSKNLFVSMEPLLIDYNPIYYGDIKQVIIGAQTNPDRCAGLEAVLNICEAADRAGAKVFMKDSLKGRWPDRELRRELAWPIHKQVTR